jgi:hypothetical protein
MKTSLLALLFLSFFVAKAQYPTFQINLQKQPTSLYVMVIPTHPTPVEDKAATEFKNYFEKVTGERLETYRDSTRRRLVEIVIGNCLNRKNPKNTVALEPDGFNISTYGNSLYITGGSDKGTLYGVYEFFERFAETVFYAPGVEYVPKVDVFKLNNLNITMKPAFRSREVYYAGLADPDFVDKMRCDRHAWKGAENWGMWVHTMFTLVPPDTYYKDHPEYYSLMAGKREKTQLCLTNPDVLKITIAELGKRMKDNPDAKYWSVSQMDTYGYCECNECKAIDKREGSPSGSIIEFVNKVAAAFPDKVISTLAYQYSRSAPKKIKPASNVNIMLCTIECDRGKPIAADTSKGSFYDDLKSWSKISSDILVWDYVIQFTNMIAPFPNLQVLQPNLQLFRKFKVNGVFEQGCHGTYSENQELRQFILAKLLWNPDYNVDSLKEVFITGYYGNATKWIKQYLSLMEQSQVTSGKPLWIYGSPVEETASFLTPALINQYDDIFGKAEYSVSLDPQIQNRVKMARLPLRYAKLEIARKSITGEQGFLEQTGDKTTMKPAFLEQLNQFVDLSNQFGVKSIHERGLSPDTYKEEVLAACSKAYTNHLAINKPYTLKSEPSAKYMADGKGSLTDGKRGFSNYHILWQGFEAVDFEMIIDLGEVLEVNYLGAEFLQDITSWIFMPEIVRFSLSEDGKKFVDQGQAENTTAPKEILPVSQLFDTSFPNTKARYVKVFAKSLLKCPDWHIGHGGKSWLFVDEVIVQKRPLP